MALLIGTITCLVLALQWGGEKYSWSSPTIGGIFGCFAALVLLFVGWEWKLAGPTSILPLGLFKSRTQVGATMSAFFCMFCLMLGTVRRATSFRLVLFNGTVTDSSPCSDSTIYRSGFKRREGPQ